MMSRPLITGPPAYGPSRGGNHPKTLRGPVGRRDRRDRAVIPRVQCGEQRGSASVTCGCAAWSNHDPTCGHFCLGQMTRNSQ